MKSKIVALSLGLVIALSTVTVLSYPREALALTTQANAQRTKVWQYLVAYSNKYPEQVPIWKIKAVFGELDKANYFAMTRVQKLAYLQANLPNSFVLGAVVWAEGFNTLSAKYFSSPAQANAQRTKVWQYLVAYSNKYPAQVPIWKIKAVFGELDKANYFAMTRVQKLAYLHANMPSSMALVAVVYAEGWQGLDVKVYQSKGSDRIKFSNDNQIYKTYWVQFFNDVFFATDGTLQKSRIAEWGNFGSFKEKKHWPKQNLDLLYNKFWTDFKENRNKPEFDCTEVKRLNLIWEKGGFKQYAEKNFPNTGSAVPISIFGDSPIDDLLIFVPVEKLIGWAAKGVIAWSKVSRVPGLATAATRAEAAGVRVAAAAVRATDITVKSTVTVVSRFLGTVEVNMARMFRGSRIAMGSWQEIATSLVRSVSRLKNSSFSRYIDEKALREVIDKTYVVSDVPGNNCFAGVCYVETGYYKYYTNLLMKLLNRPKQVVEGKGFAMILVNDKFVHTVGDYTASNTFVHEAFHAISSKVRAWSRNSVDDALADKIYKKPNSWQGGYRKLNEGLTYYHTRNYMFETFGHTNFASGYPREIEVIKALKSALARKRGGNDTAEDILRWIYFKSPTLDQFDYYLGTGFTSTLTKFLRENRYNDAINWLNRM